MNKTIENKIMFIFGLSNFSEVPENRIESVFNDLNEKELTYDVENRYTQLISVWEAKHGPIILL